jgi:hypothetical protein
MSQPREAPHPIDPCRNRSGTDLAKHRFVKIDADQGVDAYEAATDGTAAIMGVTLEAITNGYNGDIAKGGHVILEAGGAITVGAKLTGGTGGKAVATTTAGHHVGAIAKTATTSGDGDLIEAEFCGGAVKFGA